METANQCGGEEENISCQDIDVVKNKNLEAVTVEELQA